MRFARGANTPPFAKDAKDGAPGFGWGIWLWWLEAWSLERMAGSEGAVESVD